MMAARTVTLRNPHGLHARPAPDGEHGIHLFENHERNSKHRQPMNYLVSSHSHHLMVFEEFNLMWAAKTHYVSYGVKTGSFAG